jgi:hypothetical protein
VSLVRKGISRIETTPCILPNQIRKLWRISKHSTSFYNKTGSPPALCDSIFLLSMHCTKRIFLLSMRCMKVYSYCLSPCAYTFVIEPSSKIEGCAQTTRSDCYTLHEVRRFRHKVMRVRSIPSSGETCLTRQGDRLRACKCPVRTCNFV